MSRILGLRTLMLMPTPEMLKTGEYCELWGGKKKFSFMLYVWEACMFESEHVELAIVSMNLKVWEHTGVINLGLFSIWMIYKVMKH